VNLLTRKYDPDRTGFIAMTDFTSCMAEVQGRPDGERQIIDAFSVFDKSDEEGKLSIKEMKHVLERIGDTVKDTELK